MLSPSRAYHGGLIGGTLRGADELLTSAFTSAMSVFDYNDPLPTAIREAQAKIKEARSIDVDWAEPQARALQRKQQP